MRRHVLPALLLSTSLMLAACGGGGGSDSSSSSTGRPTATSIPASSVVVKGVIKNGLVRALAWQNGEYKELASAHTDAIGQFSLNIPSSFEGVLRIELQPDAGGTDMICDSATDCGDAGALAAAKFGQWQTLKDVPKLLSWAVVGADDKVRIMPVTPLSTLVVRYAESLGDGHLGEASDIEFAWKRVSSLLGIGDADPLTRPVDVTKSALVSLASDDTLRFSLLSAAFAQLAADKGKSVDAVIEDMAASFVENNGRLLQASATDKPTLQGLLAAAAKVGSGLGQSSTPLTNLVGQWQGIVAGLKADTLNALPVVDFNSAKLLTALGPMGADIKHVMTDSGAATLEDLVRSELSQFRWIASEDTVQLAGAAIEVVTYAVMGSVFIDVIQKKLPPGASLPDVALPLANQEGLTVSLNPAKKMVFIKGTLSGYDTDLAVGVTSFKSAIANKLFTYSAKGVLTNPHVKASIDGVLKIDPKETDLSGLDDLVNSLSGGGALASASLDADTVLGILAGLLKDGHGVFTVEGNAGMSSLQHEGSTLAIEGAAQLEVAMAGGEGGAIAASGKVTRGSLTLPNGDNYHVNPAKGDLLSFTLGKDLLVKAKFSGSVLTLQQVLVEGQASMLAAGELLSEGRDKVLEQLESATPDLGALLHDLLALDFGKLHPSLNGTVYLADYDHRYYVTANGWDLRVSQPNQPGVVAAQLALGPQGLLARAGSEWWLFNLDQSNNGLALVIAGSNGGEARIDLSGLLLALQ